MPIITSMLRIDLLKHSELGKVVELESLLLTNSIDKPSLSAALFKCIEAKDFTLDHLETIKLLIFYGADVNMKDHKYQSCLMLACAKANLELANVLISNGANAKELDRQQRTTIILALSTKGADPINLIKLLHKTEVDINAKDISGSTALHMAANFGHKISLDYLISAKADINALDTNHDTPLHLAFRSDQKQCIEILIQIADKNIKNLKGKTPMEEAYTKNSINPPLKKKKLAKEDGWESQRGKTGKARGGGKGFQKKGELAECFKCRKLTEVLCLDCAVEISEISKQDSAEKKSRIEIDECLRISQLKIKELEKENGMLKETLLVQSANYNLKVKRSALYLRPTKTKPYEEIRDQLQSDIAGFIRDQERWRSKVEQCYTEAVGIFKGLIGDTLQNSTTEVFGSFSTGLLLPYSDIDLVIMNENTPALQTLKELIPKIDNMNIVKKSDKIFATTIPVLKIFLEIKGQEIKIDITAHEPRHKGLECSQLVKKFSSTYNTIKSVYLILKQLMYFCNFHEPYKGGISSYGLFLILVYFYQENKNDWNLVNCDKMKQEADILVWFFDFYLNFDCNKYIVVDYEGWDNRAFKNKHVRTS